MAIFPPERVYDLSVPVRDGVDWYREAESPPVAALLDQVPAERFFTYAHIVSIEPCGQELPSPTVELEDFRPGHDAIIIACGWDVHMHGPQYYSKSPYFSPRLQEWLLGYHPGIVGGDMLSFDHPDSIEMPFIRELFQQGGMVPCPLKDLGRLPRRVMNLCVAPMYIECANAAPCRVFAW